LGALESGGRGDARGLKGFVFWVVCGSVSVGVGRGREGLKTVVKIVLIGIGCQSIRKLCHKRFVRI
jgi:hypothetical protein